ncbi:GUN4-like protein (plasmid) [Calothrix sp. NIES-4071]|nr:GUN4-like protein [Calothrix sp. NIES-4071]BAZ65053.1 GUN4-like protein [Calothrix sp. NIES-4105]
MSDNKREYDVVLGGQSPAPSHAAVLGGIEGVKRRLSHQAIEHRIPALSDALNYGKEGLKLVLRALDDSEEKVHKYAYNLSKNREEPDVKAALEKYIQHSSFIRFDGFYYNHIQTRPQFLRFYQDGLVLAVIISDYESNLPELVAKWLNKEHISHHGRWTYRIESNTIGFLRNSDNPYCKGEIGKYGETIFLDWGYATFKYYFIHMPNIL